MMDQDQGDEKQLPKNARRWREAAQKERERKLRGLRAMWGVFAVVCFFLGVAGGGIASQFYQSAKEDRSCDRYPVYMRDAATCPPTKVNQVLGLTKVYYLEGKWHSVDLMGRELEVYAWEERY